MSVRLVTAAEMQALDRRAARELAVPSIVLMENAARSVCEVVAEIFACPDCGNQGLDGLKAMVLCGRGNNGGDGLAIARLLVNRGVEVCVILLGQARDLKADPKTNLEILRRCGIVVHEVRTAPRLKQVISRFGAADVVIDAIFGTGFRGRPRGIDEQAIRLVGELDSKVVAVDIPSGVQADDGQVQGLAVFADATVAMALPKRGMALYPGREFCGEVWIGDIGVRPELGIGGTGPVLTDTYLLERGDVMAAMPFRREDGHKGTFGTTLVIAGSPGYTGAACLTSMAALRVGCGLSKLAVPEGLLPTVESRLTEVVKFGVPQTEDGALSDAAWPRIRRLLDGADVLAIGPGIGTAPETRELELKILGETSLPVVVDADGITNLKDALDLLTKRGKPTVLTPHPGELARLLGLAPADVNADRIEIARKTATAWNVTLVLKGAPTVIASPDGQVHVNTTGNNGLASGGTGDVLTGIIAGLIAQGAPPTDAARAGSYLHGMAGDLAAEERSEYGLVAGDLLDYLPRAIKALLKEDHEEVAG